MDPLVELSEADEIARKILTKQSVSDDEFRYAVMFNLTAMTQLLWELSDSRLPRSKDSLGLSPTRSSSGGGFGRVKGRALGLASLAAMAAFLAGLGLGYLIP